MGIELVEGSASSSTRTSSTRDDPGTPPLESSTGASTTTLLDRAVRADSTLGCGGCSTPIADRHVPLANSIGTGIADDKSSPVWPRMIEFSLCGGRSWPTFRRVLPRPGRLPRTWLETLDELCRQGVPAPAATDAHRPAAEGRHRVVPSSAIRPRPLRRAAEARASTCRHDVERAASRPRHIDSGRSVTVLQDGADGAGRADPAR